MAICGSTRIIAVNNWKDGRIMEKVVTYIPNTRHRVGGLSVLPGKPISQMVENSRLVLTITIVLLCHMSHSISKPKCSQ